MSDKPEACHMSKRKTADGKTVRPGMLLWTEDGQHVEKVESIDGDVVLSAYAATRWPKGMPVEKLYAESPHNTGIIEELRSEGQSSPQVSAPILPERPTFYMIVSPTGATSDGFLDRASVEERLQEWPPGSVLVTIPGTREASAAGESEGAKRTLDWFTEDQVEESINRIIDAVKQRK